MNPMIGKKIGEGGCSEVFEWGGTQCIVKVAKPNTNEEAMKKEFANTRVVWKNGLPAVRPIELLNVDGRPAIVFERIYGESLMERFMRQMVHSHAMGTNGSNQLMITAQLLNDVHRRSSLRLPSQREGLIDSIRSPRYLTPSEKELVVQHLQRLPMKSKVCHGDPNPGNIIVREGKGVFIDWMNASIGNPEADAAEYIIMVRYAILPEHLPDHGIQAFDAKRETIVSVFCEEYCRLSGITYEEIEEWIVPVAARKLGADAISEEEKNKLLEVIRSRIHR